jgi:hypothetical protein
VIHKKQLAETESLELFDQIAKVRPKRWSSSNGMRPSDSDPVGAFA